MNLLDFDDWQITGCEQNEHDMLITAKPPHKLTACPYCRDDKNLRRHALRKQIFSDLPIRISRVKILIPRQRYRCSKCRGVSYQPLPEMDEKRVATTRLVRHVETQCLTQTFVSISNAVGVSERTVRNIFGDYVERLDRERKWVAPQWLGIDEVYLGRKFRCVLANVQERTITDMLPSRDLITVASYLRKLPNKRKIEAVCIDMHGQYREAVRDALPRAQIVVDSFHLLQKVNEALDTVRKSEMRRLNKAQQHTLKKVDKKLFFVNRHALDDLQRMAVDDWTLNLPALGTAYRLKEEFYDIWRVKGREAAIARYRTWSAEASASDLIPFKNVAKNFAVWENEIFGHYGFELVTNAYVEALNGIIKLMNRIGRGYSFEAIRAKTLYGRNVMKVSTPSFSRDWGGDASGSYRDDLTSVFLNSPMTHIYGVDLDLLRLRLESGEW